MDQFNRLKSALAFKIQTLRNRPSQSLIGVDHANQSGAVEDNVFAEFRRVTVILSLLAAINSDSRQVLDSKPYEADDNFDAMKTPDNQLVMTALSILLVRNNEVVAVMAADHPDADRLTPDGDDPHARRSCEASDPASNLAAPGFADFIAFRNPEWFNESNKSPSAKIWRANPSAQYMVLPKGVSLWTAVLEDAWIQK
jgi:hypothetical protein